MGILENISSKKAEISRKRTSEALKEAKKISKILAGKFGAEEVILFGSLTEEKKFDSASDIDLAVKGLKNEYLKAYGYCLRNTRFNLDIKSYEDMPEKFKAVVDKKGIKLYGKQ